jgi:hypothetical protein
MKKSERIKNQTDVMRLPKGSFEGEEEEEGSKL